MLPGTAVSLENQSKLINYDKRDDFITFLENNMNAKFNFYNCSIKIITFLEIVWESVTVDTLSKRLFCLLTIKPKGWQDEESYLLEVWC